MKTRVGVMLVGTLVLMLVCQAQATVVISHSGAANPETEGWEKDFYNIDPYYAYTSAISPDTGYGVDAWQIDSGYGGSSNGGKGQYQFVSGGGWLADTGVDPIAAGFNLSANARVVFDKETNGNGNNVVAIRGNGWMYIMKLRADAASGQQDFDGTNGVTQLSIFHAGGTTSYETLGAQTAYYKIEMVYDPGAGSADIYINDSSVAIQNDLSPAYTGATIGNLWWGQPDNGEGGRSTVNWNSVSLDVVPEPITMLMLSLGGLALIRRRRA